MDVQRDTAIIIYTRNGERHLSKVLSAIRAGYPSVALHVIDSQSEDRSAAIAAGYDARVESISPRTFDFGGSKNDFLRGVSHPYSCILSQDCVPCSPHWLEKLIAPMRSDAKCCATFGRQVSPLELGLHAHLFYKHYYPEGLRPSLPIVFSGAFAAYRTEAVQRCPFPEGMVMSEDLLWGLEMLRVGWALRYVPEAMCIHYQNQHLGHFMRRNFDSGYSTGECGSLTFCSHSFDYLRYFRSSLYWLAAHGRLCGACAFLARECLRLQFFYLGRISRAVFGRSYLLRHFSSHPFYWECN